MQYSTTCAWYGFYTSIHGLSISRYWARTKHGYVGMCIILLHLLAVFASYLSSFLPAAGTGDLRSHCTLSSAYLGIHCSSATRS